MIEEIIPIVLFIVIAICVYLVVYFRFRTRREMHLTVRDSLEKGVELPELLINRLGEPPRSKQGDLRRGLLAVALAGGFFAFALMLGEADAIRPLFATGMFPLLIGLAYLGLAYFERESR